MFHQLTYETFGLLPLHSQEEEQLLREAERRLGMRLPESIREWYARPDALSLASTQDVLLSLKEIRFIEFENERYVQCMTENQGVCIWAARVGAEDDPKVIVNVDGAGWRDYCPKFSILIFGQIWDWQSEPFTACSQAPPLNRTDLNTLQVDFEALPGATAWPANDTFRFVRGDQTILLWSGDKQCDWNLGSRTQLGFEQLLQTVWAMSNLSGSLYATKAEPKSILEEMRRS